MLFPYGSVYDTLNKANRQLKEGDYQKSVFLLDSVITSPNLRNSTLFEALDKRARCHKLLGNYMLSLEDYNRALSITASDINHTIILLNKCDLLIQMGNYEEAENLLSTIKDHNSSINNRKLTALASVYVRTSKYIEAEDIYKNLIDNSDNKEKGISLQNLGFLYMTKGEWDKADAVLSKALPYFSENSKERYIAQSNLAFTQAFDGNLELAKSNINQAIEGLTTLLGENHPDVTTAIRKRAEIYLKSDNAVHAESDFRKYFKHNKMEIQRVFEDMPTQSRLDYWKKERPLISLAFGLEDKSPSLLLDIALFRRAMTMTGKHENIDVFSINGEDVRKALKPGEAAIDFIVYPYRNAEGKLEEHIGALLVKSAAVSFVKIGKVSDLENYRIKNKRLKEAISSGDNDYINAIYNDTVLSQNIWKPFAKSLDGIRKIYFVPDGMFNLLAVEYLAGIQEKFDLHRLTSLGNLTISRKYPAKKEKYSYSSSPFLLIGGLDYNKLPSTNDTSASVLKDKEKNHQASEYLKSAVKNYSFATLPGMREEVERIHKFIPASVLTDTMPEERFKSEIDKYRRLHISSHGYTLHTEDQMEDYLLTDSIIADMSLWASGLVLSGANVANNYKEREDGLLSAREICDLDMSNVDFMVLSACQTADGKVNDEGPAGLVRGLKNAGAKTIIATLWEVNDEAALIFMTKFYELLNKGAKPATAFADARKYLREYMVEEPELIAEFDPALQSSRIIETGEIIRSYPMSSASMWAPFILIDNIE